MALGSTSPNPSIPRFSPSTKTSMTRMGLFSSIQPSRHSGKSAPCPRSAPSTKRFIRPPPIAGESYQQWRFYTWGNRRGIVSVRGIYGTSVWLCSSNPGEQSWSNMLHWTSRFRRSPFVF